ncbi:unnamed protein product [Brassica oleracea var. botrytis]
MCIVHFIVIFMSGNTIPVFLFLRHVSPNIKRLHFYRGVEWFRRDAGWPIGIAYCNSSIVIGSPYSTRKKL